MNLIDFVVTEIVERYERKSVYADYMLYYVKFKYQDMGGEGESVTAFRSKEEADAFIVGRKGQH